MAKEKPKNHYFDNDKVEALLTDYVIDGCTNIKLRDEIMANAGELIRQIIRTHNLHNIYPGRDEAAFGDLFQIAWVQIEKTLYKFDYGPGHTKVFNMWSQVARTVMLAHIKKESRDRRGRDALESHLMSKPSSKPILVERFLGEARELCKYNDEFLELLDHIEEIYEKDDRAYEGLIGKLIKKSGRSRQKIHNFLTFIRFRTVEFSDSPASDEVEPKPIPIRERNDD